jgi:hypothetical protein
MCRTGIEEKAMMKLNMMNKPAPTYTNVLTNFRRFCGEPFPRRELCDKQNRYAALKGKKVPSYE